MRDKTGQDRSAMTRMVEPMPAPVIEARTSRKMTGGSVMARSTRRINRPSTSRPPSAATEPMTKPMTSEIATETVATSMETRPPSSRRASTSRPTPSVPRRCAALGG